MPGVSGPGGNRKVGETEQTLKEADRMKCFMGTFDIQKGEGECPEGCEYGGWNGGQSGVCGAECEKCGGTLFLSKDGNKVCVDCRD